MPKCAALGTALRTTEHTTQCATFWPAQCTAGGGTVLTANVQTELPAFCGAECTTVQ